MACLCPARCKKEWKKRVQASYCPRDRPAAPRHIIGSTSMNIFVRTAMEKNNGGRKMIMMVLYDFIPSTYDELSAKRGDRVIVLYGELDWAYVIRDDGVEGYLPWSYLASPAKCSRRTMSTVESPAPDTTNDVSFLTVAPTKALSLSTTINSLNESDDSSSSDSDIKSMKCVRCSPSKDNSACLAGYVASTPRDASRRQAKRREEIRDDNTSSGVSSDSDNPTSPTNSSPKCRLTFKPAVSDSDSGCEETNEDPKQMRTNNVTTQMSLSIETFEKRPLGNYIVMYRFEAYQENDLSVCPGEIVTALNKDDPDWYWVKTREDDEGFVPSAYLCDVKGPALPQDLDSYHADESALIEDDCPPDAPLLTSTPYRPTMNRRPMPKKMLILFDYEARQTDDISVTQGQYVYADMDNQRFFDWILVYSPVSQKDGFIPRDFAKPPHSEAEFVE
ncbi:SH3 domain-containing protein Dlish-like [Lineus longissimus]|uniref:SH3 domain-containing protein Dlish-like n=1 Tax=Lineus longissimus TaxID=88925 RepID=UPI00315D67D4